VGDTTFVAVGDVMVDIAASGSGHGAQISLAAGGSALNAALWAAACGADARVVGRIGDDLGGRALRATLEEHGVRPDLSVDSEAPTGSFLVVDGEIRADRGANAHFRPEHLPRPLEADAVLISGYLPPATVTAALELAEGTWVALAPAMLDSLPPGADAVLVDDVEARLITGAAPEDAARLLGQRFRLACVTRGAEGAVAVLDGRLETSTPEPIAGVVGVGAGDAFAAGLLVSLAGGADLREALDAACRAGAGVAAGLTR
jgi:sugar/nucleoside kinase (ribokinase family)